MNGSTLWKDKLFVSPHFESEKKSEDYNKGSATERARKRTPRSRILSLSTWATCNSTKAGGKRTLKGGVSRYSVIFCAFFARAKNGGCSRKCRGHQIRKAWPSARPGSLATYSYAGCWHDSAVNQRQVEPELTASLVDGDRQHFCFQATRPEQGDIPFFNFKVQD